MAPILYVSDAYLIACGLWLAGGVAALFALIRRRRATAANSPRRKWVLLGLSVWMCLVVLTLPEFACALFYDETDSFSFTNASQRWYRMHVQTNAAGFRDEREFNRDPSPAERQIVFTGDSFTFGHGVADVADRFSDRVAAALDEDQPGRYRVANCSMPGLETRQLVDGLLPQWLRDGYQIDILVYTFVMNDIEYFDERTAEFYANQQQLRPEFFLFRDTYFYNLLYVRTRSRLQPGATDYYGHLAESYESEPWERMQGKFDQLLELCRARDIDLRIVIFPFLHNLGEDYPFHPAHETLQAYFAEHSVPCLDLEPVLTPHVSAGLTVNAWDAHPNERTHALAADAIRAELLADVFAGSWGEPPSPTDDDE